MIRLDRRRVATPAVLLTRGPARAEAYHAQHLAGTARLDFDVKLYGHRTVKAALLEMQHHKCAYCERPLLDPRDADVEHFRPKAGFCQDDPAGVPEQPGYYWLAYAWENLLVSCKGCNQTHKRSYFPLSIPANRARGPGDDLTRERPLLIHPAEEDPVLFINFRRQTPVARAKNRRGRVTIMALGLRRPKLEEDRRKYFGRLRVMKLALRKLPAGSSNARNIVAELTAAVRNDAQYAAMARAALPEYWPPSAPGSR